MYLLQRYTHFKRIYLPIRLDFYLYFRPGKVARTVMMCIEKNDLPQGALIKINRNGTYLLFPEKIPFEKLSDSWALPQLVFAEQKTQLENHCKVIIPNDIRGVLLQVRCSNVLAKCMMTSSNGNIFRVTGLLCGEFTGPRTKASDAELWCYLWSVSEQTLE